MKRIVLPLYWWLIATHLVVLLLPVIALVGTGALARDLRRQTVDDIEHQAVLIALHAEEIHDLAGMSPFLAAARDRTLAGFRVVDAAGQVVAASASAPGEDLSQDPRVAEALAGGEPIWSQARERGSSLDTPINSPSRRADVRMFVAVPILIDGAVVGAVVASRTPREELQAFWHMATSLSLGVVAALALTLSLAVAAGRLLSRSLQGLARASHRMAAGDLEAALDLGPANRSHVSEARELAHAMASMAERLRTRLRYITEFAGHVSHEFKTPVSSLRGTVELLRDDEEMAPSQRIRFLDNALADLDRLSRLVGGLLRLARAEEGGERRIVDLSEIGRRAAQRREGVQLEGAAGLVDGNEEQITSAVDNLLENAVRHGAGRVVLRLWADGANTGVEVEDDGPGISAANLSRVFERFFTTRRSEGGTGLGLALVQAVARAHGGEVVVESAPGRTVFRIRLPRC